MDEPPTLHPRDLCARRNVAARTYGGDPRSNARADLGVKRPQEVYGTKGVYGYDGPRVEDDTRVQRIFGGRVITDDASDTVEVADTYRALQGIQVTCPAQPGMPRMGRRVELVKEWGDNDTVVLAFARHFG